MAAFSNYIRTWTNPFKLSTNDRKLFCLEMYRRWLDLVTSSEEHEATGVC